MRKSFFSEDVMVVCETDKAVELPEEIACLGIWKEKIYGISKVTVLCQIRLAYSQAHLIR